MGGYTVSTLPFKRPRGLLLTSEAPWFKFLMLDTYRKILHAIVCMRENPVGSGGQNLTHFGELKFYP